MGTVESVDVTSSIGGLSSECLKLSDTLFIAEIVRIGMAMDDENF